MRLNRNQSRIFTVDDIEFPIYVIHSDNVEEIDGLLWLDDQVVDDKNMSGETLGKRRLQSPMKSIYPLKYMIEDEIGLMKHRGRNYIDTHGRIINYEKTKTLKLVYHKIRKREKKGIATVIWLKDCPFAFAEKSPPPPDVTWAGLLYDSGIPWKIYDFTKVKKKETWRKI
tara:strand:+ start:2638 stop:3147 length:510 start_codon:yes stop_codon:yes gene_type:complete